MNISILGCGWLGMPLAKKLLAEGYGVKGSTTRSKKLKSLIEAGIEPFQIKVSAKEISGNFDAFLANTEVLIVDFPPKFKQNVAGDFVKKLRRIVRAIEDTSVQKVIFVSSTGVYKDTPKFPEYAEEKYPNGTSNSARELILAEETMKRTLHFKPTILRFGGLIGGNRNPVKQLSEKTKIKNPLAPVNLIHREDCIGIILKIIEQNRFDNIYNAVFPAHPAREQYYTEKAKELDLKQPEFDHESESVGKIITSKTLEPTLGYEFQKKI